MSTIISSTEASTLGRPIGQIKQEKMNAFISEVELTQIKPVIGDELYNKLKNVDYGSDSNEYILVNGGSYEDSQGVYKSLSGLKVAIAYFVYVKVMMSGDIESTRFGMMQKNDQYGQHISQSSRSAAYSEATDVANQYLKECIAFCRSKKLIKSGESRYGLKSAGCVIRKIG